MVDAFMPDYEHKCISCGAVPVVTAIKDGEVIYEGEQCGVCTWGEAAMADPEQWNK
jgi:hypothetical protein